MCKLRILLLCTTLFGLYTGGVLGNIQIKKLTGTETAELGTSVTLRCDSMVKNDTGVEVKWFYNRNTQIFSWVPNRSKPQVIGEFKSIIEINDNTLEQDNMHSAIHFKKVTFDMTGDYMCKISGDQFEDEETKTMVVYQPASMIEFEQNDYDDVGTLNCSVYEMYPQPDITVIGVYVSGSNETIAVNEIGEFITGSRDDFYNITKVFEFNNKQLEGDVEFICTIVVPHTSYNETRIVYYESPGVDDETTTELIYDDTPFSNYTFNDTTLLSNNTSRSHNDTITEDPLDNWANGLSGSSVWLLLGIVTVMFNWKSWC